MDIYVGNLPYKTTDDELKALFEQHGEVTSARVVIDRRSGRSKGFGFVEMTDDAAANKAIEALNGFEFDGRAIRVNASQSERRAGGSDRGDRGGRGERRDRDGGNRRRW